jgi:hypothetical protein
MVQRGENFGSALKTREPIMVGRQRRRQDLDRDRALQLRVGRPKRLAHTGFTNLGGDLVDAETGAGSEGQVVGSIAVSVDWTRLPLGDGLPSTDSLAVTTRHCRTGVGRPRAAMTSRRS